MADIGENLRSAIVGSTAVLAVFSSAAAPQAVEQDRESQSSPVPRIWYGRAEENEELDLGGNGGLVESSFDLEIISDDIDESQTIAAVVKRYLNGKRGVLGSTDFTVQGVFVEDHDDNYVPKGLGADEGYYVSALRVRLFHQST